MSRAGNPRRRASFWATGLPATLSRARAQPDEPTALAPEPAEGALRGYTLAKLNEIVRDAVFHNRHMAADLDDLCYAAWSAIVDALLTDEQPLSRRDLSGRAKAAIWALAQDHRQTYGYYQRDWYAGPGSAPRFMAFWYYYSSAIPSHETRIVERQALAQVWAALTDADKDALTALAAADGDQRAAAVLAGKADYAYTTALGRARRKAVQLFHGEETPARGMGSRPRVKREVLPCGTRAAARRHRARRETLCPECAEALAAFHREEHRKRVAARRSDA